MALGTVSAPFDIGAYGVTACILQGLTSPSYDTQFGLVGGDELNLVLYPRAQAGTVGAPTTTQRLPTGTTIVVSGKPATNPSSGTLLFEATSFTESQDGNGNWMYTGYLNLNTTELLSAIGSNQSIQVLLIIDLISASGKPQRFLDYITVLAPGYTGSEGSPTPATPTFLTAAQTQAGFVANWSFITALTGGGETDLDGQPTLGVVSVGTMAILTNITDPTSGLLLNGGGATIWQLQNNPAAVDGPGVVVPADFDSSSNPNAWVKIL